MAGTRRTAKRRTATRRMTASPGWTAVAVVGAVGTAVAMAGRRRGDRHPVHRDDDTVTTRAVTVDQPADTIAAFLRDPDRLTGLFDCPVELTRIDERRWRYLLDATGSRPDRWSVEVTPDATGREIRWRVSEGPSGHEGRLELAPAPGDRGTALRVTLHYPQGPIRRAAATLGGPDPDRALRTILRRAKALIECGVLVSTANEPAARGPAQEGVTRGIRDLLSVGGRP